MRNQLYNKGILHSERSPVFTVCIGNLALGGTGKTPMTEYLIDLYCSNGVNAAVLSRGYRRKSKGFLKADSNSTSDDLGDEVFQIHHKFPDVKVFVNEDRVEGVFRIYGENPEIDMILLDDALQHRAIEANRNILITRFDKLYTDDLYIPAGSLRDHIMRANDADVIVVSNCPANLDVALKNKITGKLKPLNKQRLFFSGVAYQDIKTIDSDSEEFEIDNCIAVTGIANPGYFISHLKEKYTLIRHYKYPDHHDFTLENIEKWKAKIKANEDTVLITTEKDAVRLHAFKDELEGVRIVVLPIKVHFFGDEKRFDEMCLGWSRS